MAMLTLSFFAPESPKYVYRQTVEAEVISIKIKSGRRTGIRSILGVRLEDGTIARLTVPEDVLLIDKQKIQIDVLESNGKKPLYRLAQDLVAP